MALQVNLNSFVTEAYADLYLADRINTDIWFATTTINNEQALITASGMLDRLKWGGTATATTTYPMSFPRDITYWSSINGDHIDLTDDRDDDTVNPGTIPDDIKKATCELALHLTRNSVRLEESEDGNNPVKDLTVGTIRLTFDGSQNQSQIIDIPSVVWTLIDKFLSIDTNNRKVNVSGGA